MSYAVGKTPGRAGRCTRRETLRRPLHPWAKANPVSCSSGVIALPVGSPAHAEVHPDAKAGEPNTELCLPMD